MAKLSAHGDEIGRIVYTTCTKAYMSDGKVLKNYGDGWKLYSTIKTDFTPASAYASSRAALAKWEAAYPAGLAYKKALHELAGQGKRLKLHTAVQLMPDDADGVWSEACDGYGDNISADVDEVSALCELYLRACEESKSKRLAKEAMPA
jgi:hypothetical protein